MDRALGTLSTSDRVQPAALSACSTAVARGFWLWAPASAGMPGPPARHAGLGAGPRRGAPTPQAHALSPPLSIPATHRSEAGGAGCARLLGLGVLVGKHASLPGGSGRLEQLHRRGGHAAAGPSRRPPLVLLGCGWSHDGLRADLGRIGDTGDPQRDAARPRLLPAPVGGRGGGACSAQGHPCLAQGRNALSSSQPQCCMHCARRVCNMRPCTRLVGSGLDAASPQISSGATRRQAGTTAVTQPQPMRGQLRSQAPQSSAHV